MLSIYLLPLLQKRDYNSALKFVDSSATAIAAIVGAGLRRLKGKGDREEIEYAMEEADGDSTQTGKGTQYLATLANVSTLLVCSARSLA